MPSAIDNQVSRKITFLLLSCLWLFQPLSSASAEPIPEVTVLIYHRFGEDKYPTTNVSVARFREQMDYLAANKYQVLPLAKLVEALHKQQPLPAKAVVITIDDGYKSVYRNGWPILREFGYPFTVFINAKSIDGGFSNYMSWPEAREMHKSGVDFQGHSYAHGRMADRPKGFNDSEYRRWIRDDLSKNSAIIHKKLGAKPRFFAIPYGEYNQLLMDEARQLGYEAVIPQDPGSISLATDPYMISREPILGREWSSMKHFKTILQRVDLPITDLTPAYGNVAEAPPSFGARILNPERYISSSFKVYVSELGWLVPKLKGDMLTAPGGKKLTRRLNRVMIKAQEKESGRTAVRSWLLVRGQDS
ncbi:MAG: polysaccharide deacetylase family protein [Thermodesulfobacteriota bacterium]